MREGPDGCLRQLSAATGARFVANNRSLIRAVEDARLIETAIAECCRVVCQDVPDGTSKGVAVFFGVGSRSRLRQVQIRSHAAVVSGRESVLVVGVQVSLD